MRTRSTGCPREAAAFPRAHRRRAAGVDVLHAAQGFFSNGEPVQLYLAAERAHRRRHPGVLPQVRRRRHRRCVRHHQLPGDRHVARRQRQGVIDALNTIIDLTVPERNQMGGTRVIPGHGRICNEADVVEYRDMVTIIRDRVQEMVKKGMTLPADQGRASVARVRRHLRRDDGQLDHRHVPGRRVSGRQRPEVAMAPLQPRSAGFSRRVATSAQAEPARSAT